MGRRLRDSDRGDESGESHEEEGDDVSDGGGDGGVHGCIVPVSGAEVKPPETKEPDTLRRAYAWTARPRCRGCRCGSPQQGSRRQWRASLRR